jgi:hypothetical protein
MNTPKIDNGQDRDAGSEAWASAAELARDSIHLAA